MKNYEAPPPIKKFGLAVFLTVSLVAVYFLAGRRRRVLAARPGPGPETESAANSPDPNEKAPALSGPTLAGKTLVAVRFRRAKVVLNPTTQDFSGQRGAIRARRRSPTSSSSAAA